MCVGSFASLNWFVSGLSLQILQAHSTALYGFTVFSDVIVVYHNFRFQQPVSDIPRFAFSESEKQTNMNMEM